MARQWLALEQDLRKGPDAFGLTGHLWDSNLLFELLGRRYGARLGVRQCQRLFMQMRFGFRKPAPKWRSLIPSRSRQSK